MNSKDLLIFIVISLTLITPSKTLKLPVESELELNHAQKISSQLIDWVKAPPTDGYLEKLDSILVSGNMEGYHSYNSVNHYIRALRSEFGRFMSEDMVMGITPNGNPIKYFILGKNPHRKSNIQFITRVILIF